MLTAILGGISAAMLWSITSLSASRTSRVIGPFAVVGWMMMIGLVVCGVALAIARPPLPLDPRTLTLLLASGVGNVAGLLLAYRAMTVGKVGIVATIVSTEGAIAAVCSLSLGESLPLVTLALLPAITVGVMLTAFAPDPTPVPSERAVLAAGLATAAALLFGFGTYLTGLMSTEVSPLWAIVPPRLVGTIGIAIPLMLMRKLTLTRKTAPLVLLGALCEVAGFFAFAVGAQNSVSVAAVLASLLGAFTALGAYLLFRERLSRLQLVGVVVIAVSVALLAGTSH